MQELHEDLIINHKAFHENKTFHHTYYNRALPGFSGRAFKDHAHWRECWPVFRGKHLKDYRRPYFSI